MSRKFIPLIIAAVFGLIATFLINTYIQQQAEKQKQILIENQQNQAVVVVAGRDIASGVQLSPDMLRAVTVTKAMIQPRAAGSIEMLIGKITLAPFSKDEQVLLNKVGLPEKSVMTLASKVPVGKRAITITIDNVGALEGMLKPDDHVDVIAMIPTNVSTPDGKSAVQLQPVTLFQNITVMAVGQEFSSSSKGGKAASASVTLALTPQEINQLTYVQEQARIRLILRSPDDNAVTQVATLPIFEPPKEKPEDKIKPPSKPKLQVEIYRGQEKEVKTLE
jgi:pilus assembly protein CpaB